ncbi:hypothetical protein [Sandarakinorhabdus sp. DWP1-3-1]|uniref:hypothetical protein n=1 Tax=Sandarakinorhabdus sp. DWP1-3-1 TaxID=2804627 RepID=UPI003CF04E8F
MIAYLAIVMAGLAAILAWPQIEKSVATRTIFVAVNAAFAYWYWIPSINILAGGYLGEDPVLPNPLVAREAVWIVLIYHLAALVTLSLLPSVVDASAVRDPRRGEPVMPSGVISIGLFAAAIGLFAWYFADKGWYILIQVATGGVSAREVMDFDNFSSSATDSLRALLEIAVIYTGLFVVGYATLKRQLVSMPTGFAFASIILVFLGTGTRATILMVLVVVLVAIASGERVRQSTVSSGRLVIGVVAAIMFIVPIAMTIGARYSVSTGQTNPVLALLVVNNDMFRELVFVMEQMQSYPGGDIRNFVAVPFTYVTPRFFGFERHIPDHLLIYNMARNDIDLILGAGNVFPGLVSDFRLVFGIFGPVAFSAFIGAFAVAVGMLGRLFMRGPMLTAAQVALAAFLFFSFRNIHPGLVLVLIFSAAGLRLLIVMDRFTRADSAHARRT